jgi:predicted permease
MKIMNPLRKLRALFAKEKLDAEMAAEMRAHLEQQTAENLARGMSADEARYAARCAFGGAEQIKERARDQRGWRWLDQLAQDFRYALRQLRRSPGFTIVAILSLAVGIGANTSIFSLFNGVWLRSLPVKNPHELMTLAWKADAEGKGATRNIWGGARFLDPTGTRPIGANAFSLREFRALAQAADDAVELFAFGGFGLSYAVVEGQTEDSDWEYVSGGIHAALGLRPAAGRLLVPADDRPDADSVAVISYRYWQHRFGGDPAAIGKTVFLQNAPVTIVGVLPPEFFGLGFGGVSDFAMPLAMLARVRSAMAADILKDPSAMAWLHVMARPQRGVSAGDAARRLQRAYHAIVRELRPETRPRAGAELPQLALEPGHQGFTDSRKGAGRSLAVLAGLAALLLAITCVNIANLMLARGSARQKEIAIRVALGASRGRVIRQLLTESAVLAALGGAGGLVLAVWGRDVLLAMNPMGEHVVLPPLPLDARVGGFVLIASAAACLCSGLWPAWRATRPCRASGVKDGLPGIGRDTRRALGAGGALIAVQIAFSVTLLVVAGLLIQTVHNLRTVDAGFSRGGRLVFGVRAKPPGYPAATLVPMLEAMVEKISALPGVRSATFGRLMVLSGGNTPREVFVAGEVAAVSADNRRTGVNDVAANFFASYEMPLLFGRGFDAADVAGAPKVAVVNRSFARKFFGEANPLGRRLGWSLATTNEIEIVGVVADARTIHPRELPAPMVYLPFRQQTGSRTYFSVRASADPRALLPAVRQAVRDVNPELLLAQIQTEEEIMDGFLVREKLIATLATAFGSVAVLLICIGLYGLISFTVVRRTKEIGIRMALGSLPRVVLVLLMGQFMRVVACGIVVGLGLSWLATRAIATFLFGLSATDATTYGIVILMLAVVALVACWLPARRAAKINPMEALRAE